MNTCSHVDYGCMSPVTHIRHISYTVLVDTFLTFKILFMSLSTYPLQCHAATGCRQGPLMGQTLPNNFRYRLSRWKSELLGAVTARVPQKVDQMLFFSLSGQPMHKVGQCKIYGLQPGFHSSPKPVISPPRGPLSQGPSRHFR